MADHELVGEKIPLSSLVTFRKGELAYHPTLGRLIELPSDMIKIKGKNGGHECIFFDETKNLCTIYEFRPLECRTLECWDPGPLMELFLTDLLPRKAIFPRGLWSTLDEYDALFPPSKLMSCLQKREVDTVEGLVNKDMAYRKDIMARGYINHPAEEAFLGRRLKVIKMALESIM